MAHDDWWLAIREQRAGRNDPSPAFTAPFAGLVEIVFGTLVIAGFLTRLASIPLIIDISVAIATTKIPLSLQKGVWAAIHEARVDFSMLLGAIFLLIAGAGPCSLDASLAGRARHEKRTSV